MKILILSPLNFPDAKQDLKLLNYEQDVYSIYYLIDIISKGDMTDVSLTAVSLILAKEMNEKEYSAFNIFFGLVPKTFDFDQIICYNLNILSAQESAIRSYNSNGLDTYYTSDDATIIVENIMEAIKIAKQQTTKRN